MHHEAIGIYFSRSYEPPLGISYGAGGSDMVVGAFFLHRLGGDRHYNGETWDDNLPTDQWNVMKRLELGRSGTA
ncbi:metalloproteinase [Aspergillus bombycis]|uniref:Metalloproteinase n=1 Tax=Aspergillus bombycis TaxID=109264 RepID=A0A1F8ACR4_9EURO|nr:metalloproteinase [Aspergillus bombycis]OGM49546.1 metalloproteinase [Aspergillus bombycis]